MDDKKPDPSTIAAEAVGERPGSPPPDTGEHAVRPVVTSAGPGARIADKTAESVGERAGDAYADATTDEARERSRLLGGAETAHRKTVADIVIKIFLVGEAVAIPAIARDEN